MWQGIHQISRQSSQSTLPDGMFKHETGPYFKTPNHATTSKAAATTTTTIAPTAGSSSIELVDEAPGDGVATGSATSNTVSDQETKQRRVKASLNDDRKLLKLREIDRDGDEQHDEGEHEERGDELRSPQRRAPASKLRSRGGVNVASRKSSGEPLNNKLAQIEQQQQAPTNSSKLKSSVQSARPKLNRKLQFNETGDDGEDERDAARGEPVRDRELEPPSRAKSGQSQARKASFNLQEQTASPSPSLHQPQKSSLRISSSCANSQPGSGDDSSHAQQQQHHTFRSRLSSISGALAHHAPVAPRGFAKLLFPSHQQPQSGHEQHEARGDLRQVGSIIQITTTSFDSPKRKRSSSGRSWGSRDSGQSGGVGGHHGDPSDGNSAPYPRVLSSSTSGRRLSQLFLPQVPPQVQMDRLNQLDPYGPPPNELLPPNMLGMCGQPPLVGSCAGIPGSPLDGPFAGMHGPNSVMLGHRNSWVDATLIGRLANIRPSLDSTGYQHATNRLRHSFDARSDQCQGDAQESGAERADCWQVMKKLFYSFLLGSLIALCWMIIIHTLKWIAIKGNEFDQMSASLNGVLNINNPMLATSSTYNGNSNSNSNNDINNQRDPSAQLAMSSILAPSPSLLSLASSPAEGAPMSEIDDNGWQQRRSRTRRRRRRQSQSNKPPEISVIRLMGGKPSGMVANRQASNVAVFSLLNKPGRASVAPAADSDAADRAPLAMPGDATSSLSQDINNNKPRQSLNSNNNNNTNHQLQTNLSSILNVGGDEFVSNKNKTSQKKVNNLMLESRILNPAGPTEHRMRQHRHQHNQQQHSAGRSPNHQISNNHSDSNTNNSNDNMNPLKPVAESPANYDAGSVGDPAASMELPLSDADDEPSPATEPSGLPSNNNGLGEFPIEPVTVRPNLKSNSKPNRQTSSSILSRTPLVAAGAATGISNPSSALHSALIYKAPLFTSWFISCWNMLFMPAFTLISSCCFRGEDSTTKRLLVRESISQFMDNGLTTVQFLVRCALFALLWMATIFGIVYSVSNLDATAVMALFSFSSSLTYFLSWVILHQQFVGIRIVAVIICTTGIALLAYMDNSRFLGSVLIVTGSAFFSAIYKVLYQRLFGFWSIAQMSLFFTIIGLFNALLIWPFVLLFYLLGIEIIAWRHIPWLHLSAAGALHLTANVVSYIGPVCSYEIFLTFGLLVAVILSAVIDVSFYRIIFAGMKMGGITLLMIGFLVCLLPANWNEFIQKQFKKQVDAFKRRKSMKQSGNKVQDMSTCQISRLRTSSGRVK